MMIDLQLCRVASNQDRHHHHMHAQMQRSLRSHLCMPSFAATASPHHQPGTSHLTFSAV